jgi:hypothetical protein
LHYLRSKNIVAIDGTPKGYRNNSVGIAMGSRLNGQGSIPSMEKIFLSFTTP